MHGPNAPEGSEADSSLRDGLSAAKERQPGRCGGRGGYSDWYEEAGEEDQGSAATKASKHTQN